MSESADTGSKVAAEGPPDPHYANRWRILAVIGVAQLTIFLDTTVVNIALPSAQADLGFGDGDRQWVVTAYALAFGSLLLLGGRVVDLVGAKRSLMISIIGFGVTSVLGGAANGFAMLVTARALQGAFAALVAPAALSFLLTVFKDPKERVKAFGVYGALGSGGLALGLVLGGALTDWLDWRWCLYVNVFFTAAVFVGALVTMRNRQSDHRPDKLDLPGTVTASVGLFCLAYGLSNADDGKWGGADVWGFLLASGVLLVAFVLFELRSRTPLLPIRIVLHRNRGSAYLAMFLLGIGLFVQFLFLTYYLQLILDFSAIQSGLAFLPMIVGIAIGATTIPPVLEPKLGTRVLVPAGLVLAAVGSFWLARLTTESSYAGGVLAPSLIAGVGFGLVVSLGAAVATVGVEPQDAGAASALVNTVQQVGGSIGTALLSTLAITAANTFVEGKSPTPHLAAEAAVESYTTAFFWGAVVFLGGAVVCGLLFDRHVTAQADPEVGAPAAVV
ncbi:Puromycin resistance protein pur8 [Streptomyces cyaneogriseus subsp. noncyanogenus]|uniref:Puromycin resistance protein pur8 n=1 Tax=Streptomyces cyaneogriseus subsp. noncyanogenus TaxID=477245 RepID=A0A0C5FLL3_9ACTN|nr:MFS transporter [Streptomyces cyaneogriseus]AJP00637.1 Puromycin resistance protein pur8 [Streptomyces cyaneogriseus subsp. noncyanogenus]